MHHIGLSCPVPLLGRECFAFISWRHLIYRNLPARFCGSASWKLDTRLGATRRLWWSDSWHTSDPKVQQEDDPSSASSSEDGESSEESSDPEPTHKPSGSGLPCGSRGQSGGPGRCAKPSGRPHLTASSDHSSSAASETHGGPGEAPDPRDSEGSSAHGCSRVLCNQPSPASSDELPASIPRRPRKASHASKSGIERGTSRRHAQLANAVFLIRLQSTPACKREAESRGNTRGWRNAGTNLVPAAHHLQGPRFTSTADGHLRSNRTAWFATPSLPKPYLSSPALGTGTPRTAIIAGGSGAGLTTTRTEAAAARARRTPLAARGIDTGTTAGAGGRAVWSHSRTRPSPPAPLLQRNT